MIDGEGEDKRATFVDASKQAYEAIVYLRIEGDEEIVVTLTYASRLASIKEITIPRLEFIAILIRMRAQAFVDDELPVRFDRTVVWSDSNCVIELVNNTTSQPVFI